MALGKFLHLSVPQFPHMQNKTKLLGGFRELTDGTESSDMVATDLRLGNGEMRQKGSQGMALCPQQSPWGCNGSSQGERKEKQTSAMGLHPCPGAIGETHHAAGPNQPEAGVAGEVDFMIH